MIYQIYKENNYLNIINLLQFTFNTQEQKYILDRQMYFQISNIIQITLDLTKQFIDRENFQQIFYMKIPTEFNLQFLSSQIVFVHPLQQINFLFSSQPAQFFSQLEINLLNYSFLINFYFIRFEAIQKFSIKQKIKNIIWALHKIYQYRQRIKIISFQL
ncbi:hypothetical protein pb186bvf_000573 [Paramecium bursaria]